MALGSRNAARRRDGEPDEEEVGPAEDIVLDLADLVRDENGEVVLFNDSGLRSLSVSTAARLADEGVAGNHVTAAGDDVSGFRYFLFDDGLRLYFAPDLELILVRGQG